MKHLALLLCLLLLVPAGGLCEKILWEDDAGQVVLSDDGNVQFVSPSGEAAAEPIEENIDENTYAPDETPAQLKNPFPTILPSERRSNTATPANWSRRFRPVWPSWGSTTPRYPAVIIR